MRRHQPQGEAPVGSPAATEGVHGGDTVGMPSSGPMDTEGPNRRQLVGAALWRLGDLTAIDEPRSYRARAYRRGVWALDDLSPGLDETAEEMQAVRGIGAGITRLIEEMRQTGTIAALELLERRYPAESTRLRQLPRMTAKQLLLLKEIGIDTAAQLSDAIDSAAVESLARGRPGYRRVLGPHHGRPGPTRYRSPWSAPIS